MNIILGFCELYKQMSKGWLLFTIILVIISFFLGTLFGAINGPIIVRAENAVRYVPFEIDGMSCYYVELGADESYNVTGGPTCDWDKGE